MSQLKQINVKPEDIKYIGISHTHPDHIGNTELFPKTTILIQRESMVTSAPRSPARRLFRPRRSRFLPATRRRDSQKTIPSN